MNPCGNPTTVALANPLWIGHHPMYFAQFAGSFLRAGARVIGLCPDPAAAGRGLDELVGPGRADDAARVAFHPLACGRRSWFGQRFEGDPLTTAGRWRNVARALRTAERMTGWRADLVFFPHVDSFVRFLPLPSAPSFLLGRPWSGLYLRNHHHAGGASPAPRLRLLAKGDRLFRNRLCLEVGVLDERYIESLAAYTGKRVVHYPDATVTGLPERPDPFAAEIVERARGRKIIGLIGLERRKGFVTMLRVAVEARRLGLPWYFVCAGSWLPWLFEPDERRFIEEVADGVAAGVIDNVHFDPGAGRIADETAFNALFSVFDVAWVAYEGFEGSSGALSKAAAFQIPSLASAGECIGGRVEAHRIGLTIPEGDQQAALRAIGRLLEKVDWSGEALCPRYADYQGHHGIARLDFVVRELLGRVNRGRVKAGGSSAPRAVEESRR